MGYFAWLGELEPIGGALEAAACPFCGSGVIWISAPDEHSHLWDAQCHKCHALGPTQTTFAALVQAWNDRASRPAQVPQLEIGVVHH